MADRTIIITDTIAPSSDEALLDIVNEVSMRINGIEAQETGNRPIKSEIIAASVRNPVHVTECALAGADIATVPYSVIEQCTKHPLTTAGIEKFILDYKAAFGE